MPLLESLTASLVAGIAKTLAKIWLKDEGLVKPAEGVIETFKKRFDDTQVTRATQSCSWTSKRKSRTSCANIFSPPNFAACRIMRRRLQLPQLECKNLREISLSGAELSDLSTIRALARGLTTLYFQHSSEQDFEIYS